MSTSLKSWLKLIILFILFSFSIGIGRGIDDLNQAKYVWNILPAWLIGLSMGALLYSITSATAQLEKFSKAFWRILFGLGVLLLIWYLPIQFSALKKNDLGFQLDAQKSPAAFWLAAAFILGFYKRLISKIPAAVWDGLKASLKRATGLDLQGSETYRLADVWDGLKCMVKDVLRRA